MTRFFMALLVCLTTGCATRFDAAKARFIEPDYVVTRYFYEEAPQRVVVLPFATRSGKEADVRKAEVCRRVFFQHMSLRDYEDVELRRFDSSMFATNRETLLGGLVDVVRALDVVGMTTVLDLKSLFGASEKLRYADFMTLVDAARNEAHADAYVVGITRSYGRFYAVLVSSIGISTRTELRSAVTGNLLWRGEEQRRNYELPLTLNPFDIPRLLYDVWRNSRGLALDSLAYDVYGDLTVTVPYLERTRQVYVETTRPYTPYFRHRTMWLLFPRGRAGRGDRFEFQLEQNGWYECKAPDGSLVWIFRDHGRLVDQDGSPVEPHADLDW
jgi:hypothetical protein